MSMRIIVPGMLTSVQDLGRNGHQASGFPTSGAADARALKAANILVGNSMGEAALEMTMLGLTAQFNIPCVIALTGADMSPKLNAEPIPTYRAIAVKKGDYLECRYAKNGLRGYLAVAGGFNIPEFMGSRSTGLKFSVGGYEGRKLQPGDVVGFRASVPELPNMEKRSLPPRSYSNDITLRAVRGPQDDRFTDEGIATFFSAAYSVTTSLDRMGVRLEGAELEAKNGYDIVSDAVNLGSIQVPASKKPIILMNDRQTTGGYLKVATVISTDMSLAAQLTPGNIISFKEVTVAEAQRVYRAEASYFTRLNRRINGRF